MMHMSFYLSDEISDLLFKNWSVSSAGGVVWTCLVIASMVLLLEASKLVRAVLGRRSMTRPGTSLAPSVTEDPLLPSLVVPPTIANYRRKKIRYHVVQTVFHVLQVVMGYFIMLAVMSYNGWIAIAVALASGLGFYIFGAIRHVVTLPAPSKVGDGGGLEASSSGSSGQMLNTTSGMYS